MMINRYAVIGCLLFCFACTPTEKKKPNDDIKADSPANEKHYDLIELSKHTLEPVDLDLIDTVFVTMLDSLLEEQQALSQALDSQLATLPKVIEETKKRISKNRQQQQLAKDPEIRNSWDKIINGEERNLSRFNKTFEELSALQSENTKIIHFMTNASKQDTTHIAYFIVEARYEQSDSLWFTNMLLDPGGQLLKEFIINRPHAD